MNEIPGSYVVLFHQFSSQVQPINPEFESREDHWDLMIQDRDHLLTWEVLQNPLQPGIDCEAKQLADHRLHYLQYEGPVSDGRGYVTRVGQGSFSWIKKSKTRYKLQLMGSFEGTLTLNRIQLVDQKSLQPSMEGTIEGPQENNAKRQLWHLTTIIDSIDSGQ